MAKENKNIFKEFPKQFWLVVIFEFFERGSYYGMMSVLSIYLTEILGFSKEGVGIIKSTIQPLLYFLPILTGAIADKLGYRRTLMIAFAFLGTGYFLTAQMVSYAAVFIALVIMGIGAGTFKPIISGTIAKLTNEKNSTLGFGIYYWSINFGAFLFPLIIVPILKSIDWRLVMIASALGTGLMIIPTFFMFKEPPREIEQKEPALKSIIQIFKKILDVASNWRFILFIFIYSLFWILYFQMFDSVLWYFQTFVDATPLNNLVNSLFNTNWKFDVEHITVINALTIIALQLFVSNFVKNFKAFPTIIAGLVFGVLGMAMLAISNSIWVLLAGLIIFSFGEMTAHPKYISYLGDIAPQDKKATYMGFGFLYGVFGSGIGGVLGAFLYVRLIDNPMIDFVKNKLTSDSSTFSVTKNMKISEIIEIGTANQIPKQEILSVAHTQEFWLIFAGIGVLAIFLLLAYDKLIGVKYKH
jgi:dipeptide/tripeptide permease